MKYYVVFKGVKPGVYKTWEECESQVKGFKGAKHQSYNNMRDALVAFDDFLKSDKKPEMFENVFDNGFKIKLPFKLNEQQVDVINQIDEFINSPELTMTISGWAGTGKTTLMEIVAKRYWYSHKIHFAATTHKAAGVLRTKVGKNVSTVNSLFGINVEIDMDGDVFDASKKKNTKGDEKLTNNSIVIIDESSMLSETNYQEVIDSCTYHNAKVIFIGDSAQLSPVNEEDISIVFRDEQARIVELTKVERTDDNSILNEATNIRLGGNFSYKSDGNVIYISGNSGNEINDIFDKYIPGLAEDPNYFRVLTYTNKSVEKLNTAVRKKLGYMDMFPQKGEPMMSYANWGYLGSYPTTTYKFINSEAYTCGNVIGERDINITDMISGGIPFDHSFNNGVLINAVDIELIDGLGNVIEVPYIDVRNNPNNYASVTLLSHEKIKQWNRYKQCHNKLDKLNCIRKINAIDNLLFVNDNVKDSNGYLLQQKVIDFGYAHTIHKSQGSTFEHVLINDIDINNCSDETIKRQLRYVGLTRARQTAIIITKK